MGLFDTMVNSRLKNIINSIADKIAAKQTVTKEDFDALISKLGRVSYQLRRKKDFETLKAFCGGIASAFERIDEIAATFEDKTKIPISNIKVLISDVLSKEEEEMKEEGMGIDDIKSNIMLSLNQLSAFIKSKEIRKAVKAEAAAQVAA